MSRENLRYIIVDNKEILIQRCKIIGKEYFYKVMVNSDKQVLFLELCNTEKQAAKIYQRLIKEYSGINHGQMELVL